jgi:glycosyltransferase involved in cell wall biosynthesis
VKIVALPRDPNPYLRHLYDEIERAGHSVRYAGSLTRSRTLNLLLLPFELTACRLTGWRVLHVHWVFAFTFPGSDRLPCVRRLSQGWFSLNLILSRLLGMRVIWTLHNVLPHQRVFQDDVAARRLLVRSSHVVLAHSRTALDELDAIGMHPRRSAVVGLGPVEPRLDAAALRPPGWERSFLQFVFFGQVLEYKGVEELLEAMRTISPAVPARLVIAGQCRDPELRQRLHERARACDGRVELRLERIPDQEVAGLMSDSDIAVLPFRRVTTSFSALLAMGYGRVLIVPDLAAFAGLPRDAAVLYDGSLDGLRRAMTEVAQLSPQRLRELGAAARAHVETLSWTDVARRTLIAMSDRPAS